MQAAPPHHPPKNGSVVGNVPLSIPIHNDEAQLVTTAPPLPKTSSSSTQAVSKGKRKPPKKKRSPSTEEDDIPSPDAIKQVQFLEKAEELIAEFNKMNNSLDFEAMFAFHEKHCHPEDAVQSCTVLLAGSSESEPSKVLLHREIKGFAAMASYSASSVLCIPDGNFDIRNPSVHLYTAESTPYKSAHLQPRVNALGVDETNYGMVITADYFNTGTKMYEIEVVEEKSVLESQNVLEDAVLSLQSLAVGSPFDLSAQKKTKPNGNENDAHDGLHTYSNLAPIDPSSIFETFKYSTAVSTVSSRSYPVVLDRASTLETNNNSSSASTDFETDSVSSSSSSSSKQYVAKSVEAMPVFISTRTARFRRGSLLPMPIKLSIKGTLELHIDHFFKIRKCKYIFSQK